MINMGITGDNWSIMCWLKFSSLSTKYFISDNGNEFYIGLEDEKMLIDDLKKALN